MLSLEKDLNLFAFSNAPGSTERVYFQHLYRTLMGYSPFLLTTLLGYLAAGKLTMLSWRTEALLRGNADKSHVPRYRMKLNALCIIFTLSLIVDTMRVTKEYFSTQLPPNTSCFHLALITSLVAELIMGVAVAHVTQAIWIISNIFCDFLGASGYIRQTEEERTQHATWRYIFCLISMVLFTNLGYLYEYSTAFMLFSAFCLVFDLSMMGGQAHFRLKTYAMQQLVWKPILFILTAIVTVIFVSSQSSEFWDQAALINSKLRTAETNFALNCIMNYILPAMFMSPFGWFLITCLRFDKDGQQQDTVQQTAATHDWEAWFAQLEKHNPYLLPLNEKVVSPYPTIRSLPRRNYYRFALIAFAMIHVNLLCLLSVFEVEKVEVEMYAFWSAYLGEIVLLLTVLVVARAKGELAELWKFS